MVQVDCPDPAELDQSKEYCPAIDLVIATDGVVNDARLVAPPEFLGKDTQDCWRAKMLSWRLPRSAKGLELRGYTSYCTGFLTKPDPAYLSH